MYYIINDIIIAKTPLTGDKHLLESAVFKLSFLVFMMLLHSLKVFFYVKGYLQNNTVYYIYSMAWLLLILFSATFMDFGYWTYALIVFSILVTSLTKGTKPGFVIVASAFLMQSAMSLISLYVLDYGNTNFSQAAIYLIYLYLTFSLFAIFCGMVYKDGIENQIENKSLMEQLEEKYLQIEVAQEEIKSQYNELKGTNDKLAETNSKLEKSNERLNESVAEFYTLQQISQAIGSILDTKELLIYLNDIILGVMGVNYSTIILFDEKTNSLKVHTTNISNANEAAILFDNINCYSLLKSLNSGLFILENNVDPEKYSFTSGRDINSFICTPLNTKSRKFGLVLVEHKYGNALNEDNARLLNIIAHQVGIAMENAELYRKMQELASRDGLTGIYNRQYFQEKLKSEIQNAQKENYPLSLAIYDIDHFKRFNDTFGHLFGDKVLKSITKAVSAFLGENEIIARFGGEEFILLFPHYDLNEAYKKTEALRKMIAMHIIKDNLVTASVTISFGVSCYGESALSENELLRTADDALYEAKASGRNCVRIAKRLLE